MITEDRDADVKLRVKLAGMEAPDDPGSRPEGGEFKYAPDPLVDSPLWQAHNRMMQRDATRRRN